MTSIITFYYKKRFIVFYILIFHTCLYSQTIVWQENFTYPNSTTVGTGNRWTATTTSSPTYFEVQSNEFRGVNLQSEQILETEVINISSYSTVNLSVDIRTVVLGNMEDSDYVKVYYILDGGSETIFTTNGTNINDLNPITATQTGLIGTTLKIRIKVYNTFDNETYGIDNILIEEPEPAFFDSDGDGIDDNIDIDDDNDGIKDADEENSCRLSPSGTTATYKFLNETFGTGSKTTINTTYNATTTYCFEDGSAGSNTTECPFLSSKILDDGEYCVVSKITGTVASDPENIHGDLAWYNGTDHTGDIDGRMAVFNASFTPGVFYTATINGALPNVPITYSFWALNIMAQSTFPGSILPDITVEFLDLSNNVITSINTGEFGRCSGSNTDNSCQMGVWKQFTTSVNLGNVNAFTVRFINNAPGGGGNDLALDDILISQTLCDADSDGVADIFDLDSDNDGIPDIVECGNGSFSNGTAKIPTGIWVDTNSNGMHDAAESTVAIDSDGDTVPNYLDLDSDNDSIFDVDESGAGNPGDVNLQNGDGDINGDGVGDGLDTDAFRETDINSDNILEYFTDGILDIYDFYEGATFNNSYGNENQGKDTSGWVSFVIDSDNDAIPDYIDIKSNGTTNDIIGTLYLSLDANSDGIIDGNIDTDGDGILDAFDTDNTVFGSPRDLNRKLDLNFDGRNDYVEESSVFSSWPEATLMCWIKIDPVATGIQRIIGQDSFYIQLNTDKSITTNADGNTSSYGSSISTNQWTHVSATYSSSGSILKLFINGLEVSSKAISGSLSSDTSSFSIGRKPDTNSNYYHGGIDEIKIFNKALSTNELQKIVYQEVENNLGTLHGAVIPLDITDYVNSTTITPLDWTYLKRYYKLDIYKDDIIDDLTTIPIDTGTGAKVYNVKLINVQSAPLPFITQQSGSLPIAVNITSDGVNGNDAITYDWSIVKIEHDNVTFNADQKHLGLFVNQLDASSNPIEFSIQDNTELNISWYLKLDGFIDLDGESQLVQGTESVLEENSAGYVERDQQGTANSFNYNYWSSSVGPIGAGSNNTNQTIAGILFDGSAADDGIYPRTINFQPAHTSADSGVSAPINISTYWLNTFNGTSNDYGAWNSIDETSSIKAGEGYTMKGTSGNIAISTNQNYVFKGKPNNGTITLTVASGDSRLVGNPYPSALDADEFIKDNISTAAGGRNGTTNVFNGAVYFWDHFGKEDSHYLAEYVGGYATYTLMGGAKAYANDARINNNLSGGSNKPERYIPVNQAFFVNTTIDTLTNSIGTDPFGGTITFKNSQRIFVTEGSGNSQFMKSENPSKFYSSSKIEKDSRPKIRLLFSSPEGYHRQLLIGADKNASLNFDLGYDGQMIDVGSEDMYWDIDNGKFVIQGVSEFRLDLEIPLGIIVNKEGIIQIKIDELENLEDDFKIYIKDNLTGEITTINNKAFQIQLEPGKYKDRFSLIFMVLEPLNVDDEILNNGILAFMNNSISELQIRNNINAEIESVKLFNYLGQLLKNWVTNLDNKCVSLPLNISSGTYIIQINTSKGIVSKKIIKK